jgi:hypothetical protein
VVEKYSAEELENAGRFKQLRISAVLLNQQNKKALPITFGSGLAVIAVLVVIGLLTGTAPLLIPLGVVLGLTTIMLLFFRFVQAAQYSSIEGQLGAAAAVLRMMRNWTVTPGVASNKSMDVVQRALGRPVDNVDLVHRAVGRPGVVLVGEGDPKRLASLMATEKKKTARVAFDVPVFEFQVGSGEGQIKLSQLQKKMMRLPRNLKPAAVSDLNNRLKAIQSMPSARMSQNVRMPKMPRPRMR